MAANKHVMTTSDYGPASNQPESTEDFALFAGQPEAGLTAQDVFSCEPLIFLCFTRSVLSPTH